MGHTARDLLRMSGTQLDDVFRRSPAGPLPTGESRGTPIVVAGSWLDGVLRPLIRLLAWKGKVFQRADVRGRGSLKNLIGPFGFRLFEAEVYRDESWFDEGPAIVLDYSNSSFLVRRIRDEIREVAAGLYLGQVFWGKRRILRFMLEFPQSRREAGSSA